MAVVPPLLIAVSRQVVGRWCRRELARRIALAEAALRWVEWTSSLALFDWVNLRWWTIVSATFETLRYVWFSISDLKKEPVEGFSAGLQGDGDDIWKWVVLLLGGAGYILVSSNETEWTILKSIPRYLFSTSLFSLPFKAIRYSMLQLRYLILEASDMRSRFRTYFNTEILSFGWAVNGTFQKSNWATLHEAEICFRLRR